MGPRAGMDILEKVSVTLRDTGPGMSRPSQSLYRLSHPGSMRCRKQQVSELCGTNLHATILQAIELPSYNSLS